MDMTKRKLIKKVLIIVCVLGVMMAAVTAYGLQCNRDLELTQIPVSSPRLPESFSGFKIAQVSDLHNTEFGDGNEALLAMLKQANPDIIAITGDLIDYDHTDVGIALTFAGKAVKIAPCYFVTGNHEADSSEYGQLETGLKQEGVTILSNKAVRLERKGQSITLAGIDDPHSTQIVNSSEDESTIVDKEIRTALAGTSGYTLLLSHRPEVFDTYCADGIDLTLAGHAHGGQVRLPFIGGIIAPNQGLFPKYDSGLYTKGNTSMVVSRGLGNSSFPLRINDRPEVVLVELESE